MGRVYALLTVVVVALSVAAVPSRAASGPPNVIRVGGPSDPDDPKIAVVGSSTNLAGSRFRVVDEATGLVVLSGRLRRAPRSRVRGGGPAPWAYAETADLSAVTTPGSYRVRVGRKRSDVWVVKDDAATDLMHALLDFFPIAADGNETSPVHDPSHLNDADLVTNDPNDALNGAHFDLTGGWMDAGDPDKWVFTMGFTTWALEVAHRQVPSDSSITTQADVGVRWLLKMHPAAGVFIGQVGDADHERNYFAFRNPDTDDDSTDPIVSNRPAYETRRSDVAGKAAAALALASTRVPDPEKTIRINAAEDWYAMGKANETAANDPSCAGNDTCTYDDTEWKDDMALAGAELFAVTGTQSYLDEALAYLADRIDGSGPDGYTVDPFAGAEICGKLGAPALGTQAEIDQGCAALDEDAGIAVERARNPFLRASEVDIATSCRGAAEGIIAAAAGNRTLAANERDYLLGRNPWGLSFVVGFSDPSTQHAYHWLEDFNGSPDGWLVPGPTSAANFNSFGPYYIRPAHGRFDTRALGYSDNHELFHYNEGSVDCQALGVLLAAFLAS